MYILTRSCINEVQLCKGIPLCDNMNDLKWCKNSTMIDEDWKSISEQWVCSLAPQTDGIVPHGQLIEIGLRNDGTYHCLNRADENPFLIKNYVNDTWLQWANTPCDNSDARRCLGSNPEQCCLSYCKI